MSKKQINSGSIPDRGAGNDPEPLGLAFHHQGSTLINAHCKAAINLVDKDRAMWQ